MVGSCIVDKRGLIHSWGWNSCGPTGYGLHSEIHAINRSNKKRLKGSTIYVASQRSRNKKAVFSKPCADCQRVIDSWGLKVIYREREDWWV